MEDIENTLEEEIFVVAANAITLLCATIFYSPRPRNKVARHKRSSFNTEWQALCPSRTSKAGELAALSTERQL